jgi:cbb3-type cytochrome oxidase maturation protein
MSASWAQLLLTLSLAVIFLGFLIWGIRTGQFRNIEEPKYRIFDDKGEEEEKVNEQTEEKEG